jgi:hypothetical protein
VVTPSRYRMYPIDCARIGFRPMSSSITSGTVRPVLLIVAPPYSADIVAGDTIFEQGLVAAPTATVRPAHNHPAFVVTQPGGHGTRLNHILVDASQRSRESSQPWPAAARMRGVR